MGALTVDPGFQKRAWIKVGIGGVSFAAMLILFFFIGKFSGHEFVFSPFGMIPFSIPFVCFCIGLIEVVSGRPYRQLAAAWMSLRGCQRGIIGTIIVIASLGLILLGVAFIFTYLVR